MLHFFSTSKDRIALHNNVNCRCCLVLKLIWEKKRPIKNKIDNLQHQIICYIYLHSRMKETSSTLVTASDKNSSIGVFFHIDYDFIVRILTFRHGTAIKFLKNLRTFLFLIFGQRHGVIISVQPIRIQLRSGGKSIFSPCFSQTFLFVLKARVSVLFTGMRWKSGVRRP